MTFPTVSSKSRPSIGRPRPRPLPAWLHGVMPPVNATIFGHFCLTTPVEVRPKRNGKPASNSQIVEPISDSSLASQFFYAISANTSWAAVIVRSMSFSVCAVDTNMASYWLHGR